MGRFLRRLGLLFAVVLAIGAVLLGRVLFAVGYFTKVEPHFAGTCKQLPGVVGAEDIELDRTTGTVFISSQDRRPLEGPWKPGALYIANIDKPDEPPRLAFTGPDFHPHGISLFTDPAGRQTLAVVNHPMQDQSEVILFDVSSAPGIDTTPSVRRTVKDALFGHLNDVTLVGHEKFYATNSTGSKTKLGEQLETWLLLPRANVVYYDGSAAAVAADGFNFANGINHNADATEIFVAESTGRELQTFRRDPNTGALLHTSTLAIAMGLDNIDVDSSGDLWIAAHPHMLDFLSHAKDPKNLSPSAVVKVHREGGAMSFEAIYVNAGEEISASSVAVADKGKLLIGAVFDPKYLSCTLPSR